jgi:signal transduction histidine kinase
VEATEPHPVNVYATLLHTEYQAQWTAMLEECRTTGKDVALDYPITRPSDGGTIWISDTCRVATDTEGKPLKLYGTIQDITERKNAEEAILRANEELERRVQERTAELAVSMEKERRFNEAKTEFVSLLSHQFRTPLTIILSASELLERVIRKTVSPVPELVERNLYKIGLQIKTMSEMLSGVSRLMNVQTNILREQLYNVGTNDFCQQTLREFQNRYPSDPPRTVNTVLPDNSLTVRMQFVALQTAVLEILHNADQYSPKDTPLMLECRPTSASLQFRVTDTGKGVPDGEKALIFDLFQRGEQDRETGDSRGLGIGLTMAKMCVEAMNGKVWCEDNASGIGSTFVIELPLQSV